MANSAPRIRTARQLHYVEGTRPLRRHYVHLRCGGETIMALALAEIFAANPNYFRGVGCSHCGTYSLTRTKGHSDQQ